MRSHQGGEVESGSLCKFGVDLLTLGVVVKVVRAEAFGNELYMLKVGLRSDWVYVNLV